MTPERGALEKLLGWEGGSENFSTSKPTGGGGLLKNSIASKGGAATIPSFEFQYLHSPLSY